MASKVLVNHQPFLRRPGPHTELLQERGCEIVDPQSERPSKEELLTLVPDVAAILSGTEVLDAEVLAAAPRLKVISRHGVGYDNVDIAAATRAGVVVTITAGTNHVSVAELALGLIISLARQIPQSVIAVRSGLWKRPEGIELAGKTVGIVGLGRIGKSLALRLRALEMPVLASDVIQDAEFAHQHEVAYVPLDELLRRSDFVTLHVPANPSAGPVIGETQLGLMKPGAFLVNTARGTLVDEVALYRALTEGRLAGAGLDVLAQEPPGPNPLLGLENVLVTPHMGGTREVSARSAVMAVQNILQVLRGERCPYAVNPEVYVHGGDDPA